VRIAACCGREMCVDELSDPRLANRGRSSNLFGRATSGQDWARAWRFCACGNDERAQKHAFRAHDAPFFLIEFDAPGERAEVIAAAVSAICPYAPARCPGKRLERLRCDRWPGAINRLRSPLSVAKMSGIVGKGR
jgi:hypothetical protein